jgi:hypothetical protein
MALIAKGNGCMKQQLLADLNCINHIQQNLTDVSVIDVSLKFNNNQKTENHIAA